MPMIRIPSFLRAPATVRIHRDEAVLSSPNGQIAVTAPWFGDLASLINGVRLTHQLVALGPDFEARAQILDTLMRLEAEGILVDAAPGELNPATLGSNVPEAGDDALLLRQANPVTGLVPYMQRRDSDADFLHVVWAPALMPAASEPRQGDDARVVVGTGITEVEAITSCVGEAVERFSLSFQGTEKRVHGLARELESAAVKPSELLLISQRQYREREQSNRDWGGEVWLSEPPDDDGPLDWTPVWSLIFGCQRYIPSAWCFMRYPSVKREMFGGDSNGCAAGRTLEKATVSAFCELVERDALAIWWYNRIPRSGLDLFAMGGEVARHLHERLRTQGRTLHLLDLTTDLNVPVVAAISAVADGSRVAFGFGSNLRIGLAARRALLEMQQVLGAMESAEKSPLLQRWSAEINLRKEPWLAPAVHQVSTAVDVGSDAGNDLAVCVETIRRRGMDFLVANCTRPAIKVPAVRVVVPGLRPASPRFAPGRLYDVPCRLGWRDRPLAEEQMNPFPFFL